MALYSHGSSSDDGPGLAAVAAERTVPPDAGMHPLLIHIGPVSLVRHSLRHTARFSHMSVLRRFFFEHHDQGAALFLRLWLHRRHVW